MDFHHSFALALTLSRPFRRKEWKMWPENEAKPACRVFLNLPFFDF
jgi:hypothetical protein